MSMLDGSLYVGPGRRNTTDPRVSIVVPALNEAQHLAAVLPALPDVHEVILVDGGSVDGSVQAARQARPELITVLQTRGGRGHAMAAGLTRVTGDVVVLFDPDGSADPDDVARLVVALQRVADLATVSGRRVRRTADRLLDAVFRTVFRTRAAHGCSGSRAFWADLIPLLDLPARTRPVPEGGPDGADLEIGTLVSCRFAAADLSVTEVAVSGRPRPAGIEVRTFGDDARALRTVLAEWRRARAAHRLERRLELSLDLA